MISMFVLLAFSVNLGVHLREGGGVAEAHEGWYIPKDRHAAVKDNSHAAVKDNSISSGHIDHRRRGGQGQPCVERPVGVNEHNASVIFTGTVRDLVPDLQHPGMQRASVEIKRVMKGGFILSRMNPGRTVDQSGQRRVVTVDGIGDPEICHSETRVHDTKIFLVNNASNGALRLSSSLVRLTLENIEQTEEAVKGLDVLASNS